MAASRRPLGAGIITLIVVDAVLVVILVIMFVQSRPADDPGSEADGTTSADSSPDPADDAESVVFASPTRNITCTIGGDSAGCEIAHFMYDTPTLQGCTGDVGHEIEVTADGAGWVCRTGSPPPTPSPDIEDLDWGDSVNANGFTCTSANDGVTCLHDESGHSFSLARRVYSLD